MITLRGGYKNLPKHPLIQVDVIRRYCTVRFGELAQAVITFDGERIGNGEYLLADGTKVEAWAGSPTSPSRIAVTLPE